MLRSEFERELKRMGYYLYTESGINSIINIEDDATSVTVEDSKIDFCHDGPNRPLLRALLENYFKKN